MSARAVDIVDDDLGHVLATARDLLLSGNNAEAAAAFERVITECASRVVTVASRTDQRTNLADALVGLAHAYTAFGRPGDALDLAREADQQIGALAADDDAHHRLHRSSLRALADAHAALGEHDIAAERYQQLIRCFRPIVMAGGTTDADAELCGALEAAARCHLALGRPEAAVDCLTGAVRRWRPRCASADADVRHRTSLVRCLLLAAEIEAARGHEREAGHHRAEAEALAANLPDHSGHVGLPDIGVSVANSGSRERAVYGNPQLPSRHRQQLTATSRLIDIARRTVAARSRTRRDAPIA